MYTCHDKYGFTLRNVKQVKNDQTTIKSVVREITRNTQYKLYNHYINITNTIWYIKDG